MRLTALAALLTGTASAQTSAVERCREAATDAARIACLEAALTNDAARKPEAAPETAGKPHGIGAGQVKARSSSSATLESAHGLRVAGYSTVPYRRLQIELENGQVWRQIEGDTQRIRVDLTRNQTVDINESSLGGYKMRLNEIHRTIRVERIK